MRGVYNLARHIDLYASRLPTPDDALLVVEVADSSLLYDRRRKVPLYARTGVRELWLVSLPEQAVTVYRDPTPTGYRTVEELHRGERIAPLAFPDREVAVADLLG